MRKAARPLAALVLASVAFSASALSATIKREVPLLLPGAYLKNTPIEIKAGTVNGEPEHVAFDGLQIWVTKSADSTVQRYDAVSNKPKGSAISVPGGVRKLVFDGTYMWAFTLDGRAYKFSTGGNLASGFPITLIHGSVEGAAFDGESIWGVTPEGLTRIDVASAAVTYVTGVGYGGSVTFDGRYLWTTTPGGGIEKVDPSATPITSLPFEGGGGQGTNAIAFDGRYVWVSAWEGDTVTVIDPAANTAVATVSLPSGSLPHSLATDGQFMWVVCSDASTVVKVDARTAQIAETIQLPAGSQPYHIEFDGTHMWVTCRSSGLVYKLFARL